MARSKKSFPSYKPTKAAFDAQINALTDMFNEAIDDYRRVSVKGMEKAIMLIADEALRLTPVDTEALYQSQYVMVEEQDKKLVGTIGYYTGEQIPKGKVLRAPDNVTDYAVFVHEIPYHHEYPTQWKFLETAFMNKGDQAVKILADTLRKTRR